MKKRMVVIAAVVSILAVSTQEHASEVWYNPFDRSVDVTFVGDIMLDRYIRSKAEENGYENITDDQLKALFSESDIVVGNLEGPVTSFPSVSVGAPIGTPENTRFTFPPESLVFLKENNFTLVSIGNNHIADFGKAGVTQTHSLLNDAGIVSVGDPHQPPYRATEVQKGIVISFLAYNQFLGATVDETVTAIKEARETSDWVVVLTHWGEEYTSLPNEFQKRTAREFIDAGADLVIGSHPHVIQSVEEYNGGLIAYSLGNFVFDQYWNDGVRCGKILNISFTNDDFTVGSSTSYLQKDGTVAHAVCGP